MTLVWTFSLLSVCSLLHMACQQIYGWLGMVLADKVHKQEEHSEILKHAKFIQPFIHKKQ